MRLVQTAVALTALTWLAVTPAIALELGGAKIRGNAEQTVTARTVLNVAAGSRSKAGQSIATVHTMGLVHGVGHPRSRCPI
jgi:hypothetical protein